MFAYFCKHFNAILAHLHLKGVTHFYHASNVPPYFKKKKSYNKGKCRKTFSFLKKETTTLRELFMMKQTTLYKGHLQNERTKTR